EWRASPCARPGSASSTFRPRFPAAWAARRAKVRHDPRRMPAVRSCPCRWRSHRGIGRHGSNMDLVIWEGIGAKRWEVAQIELLPDGVGAEGPQIGVDPVPYRLDYRLDAASGFVTRRLDVRASGDGWSRRLRLEHDGRGIWGARVDDKGTSPVGPPGAST